MSIQTKETIKKDPDNFFYNVSIIWLCIKKIDYD